MSDDDYYRRLDRDRDFYRDLDRRLDYERADRQDAFSDQQERSQRAWKAIRDGDVSTALWNAAGPDAALSYLEGRDGTPAPPRRLPHAIVETLSELVDNVEAVGIAAIAPRTIDRDGDAVVDVHGAGDVETFWVKRRLLEDLRALADAPSVKEVLIGELARLAPPED